MFNFLLTYKLKNNKTQMMKNTIKKALILLLSLMIQKIIPKPPSQRLSKIDIERSLEIKFKR